MRSTSASRAPAARKPAAKERVLEAAYELFSGQSTTSVGVEAIVARSGVAKGSFYKYFASKDDLVVAFLHLWDERWTHAWLIPEVTKRARAPDQQLLALFDVLGDWFHATGFAGCPPLRELLSSAPGSRVHAAAAEVLANLRAFIERLASQAHLHRRTTFARAWDVLLMGSIVAAVEGDGTAARHAKRAATLILGGWQRAALSAPK